MFCHADPRSSISPVAIGFSTYMIAYRRLRPTLSDGPWRRASSGDSCASTSSCIILAILWASMSDCDGLPLVDFLQKGKLATCCWRLMFLFMVFAII